LKDIKSENGKTRQSSIIQLQEEKIQELNIRFQKLIESPLYALKQLALELFSEGDIERGNSYLESARCIDKNISLEAESDSVNMAKEQDAPDFRDQTKDKFSKLRPLSSLEFLEKELQQEKSFYLYNRVINLLGIKNDIESNISYFRILRFNNTEAASQVLIGLKLKNLDFAISADRNIIIIKKSDTLQIYELIIKYKNDISSLVEQRLKYVTTVACLGYLNIFEFIFGKNFGRLSYLNHELITSLEYAAQFGNFGIVKYLMEKINSAPREVVNPCLLTVQLLDNVDLHSHELTRLEIEGDNELKDADLTQLLLGESLVRNIKKLAKYPETFDVYSVKFRIEELCLRDLRKHTKFTASFGFSLAVDMRRIELYQCEGITRINLDAPKLLSFEAIGCVRLTSLKLRAPELKLLMLRRCGTLSSVNIEAIECTVDVRTIGSRYVGTPARTKVEWATFFNKCRVKHVIHDLEGSNLYCNIHMFGLSGTCSGTSWLHSRLSGETWSHNLVTIGVGYRMIKHFPVSETLQYDVNLWDHNNNDRFRKGDLESFRSADIYIFSISYSAIMNNGFGCEYPKPGVVNYCLKKYNDIKSHLEDGSICILAGTMVDRDIDDESINTFRKVLENISVEHKMLGPVITSAKDNIGFDELRELIKEAIGLFNYNQLERSTSYYESISYDERMEPPPLIIRKLL
jgi:hypothetical protein